MLKLEDEENKPFVDDDAADADDDEFKMIYYWLLCNIYCLFGNCLFEYGTLQQNCEDWLQQYWPVLTDAGLKLKPPTWIQVGGPKTGPF